MLALDVSGRFEILPVYMAARWVDSAAVGASVPATWALFALGLLGLHLAIAQREGGQRWLVWMAAGVTCAGTLLLLVGGPLTLQAMGPSNVGPVGDYVLFYSRGAHYGYGAYGLAGYVVLGVGLLGTGWLALRTGAFGRLGWVPLAVGILSLVDALVVITQPQELSASGFPAVLLELYYGVVFGAWIGIASHLVWAFGWVALGAWLWSRPVFPSIPYTAESAAAS